MNESPYLSDTVVSTAIVKEDVLPNAMIRDVMVANPNTAKSNKLMDKLDERYEPMPEYMKAQILYGRSIVSIREESEADLARYRAKKTRAMNEIVSYYRRDTLNPIASADSIILLYQNENQLWAKYNLAYEYMGRGDSANAIACLHSIPVAFDLDAKQADKYQNNVAYFEILTGLISEGRTVSQVDSTDKTQLYSLLGTSSGKINILVRNLLIISDTLLYQEPYLFPDMLKSAFAYNDYFEKTNTETPKYLSVHPNPAKEYIIVECKTKLKTSGFIYVANLLGNLVATIKTSDMHNHEVLDTRLWKPGLYVATLKANGKTIESAKFTIIN
jgi:Secretion system C-terminal sorting domain